MFAANVPSASFAEAEKEICNTLSQASTVESLSAILDEAENDYESERSCASEDSSSSTKDCYPAVLGSVKSTPFVPKPTAEVMVAGLECQPSKTLVSTPKAVSIFGTLDFPVHLRRLPSVQASEKRIEEFRKPRTSLFERAAAARLEKREQQEALAVKQAIEEKVAAEASPQLVSSFNLRKDNHCSELRLTPILGQAATKPQPTPVERPSSSKCARIRSLPSARSPVARKEENICGPRQVAAVAKSSASKFARIRSLPSAMSPAAPKEENTIESRQVKAVEKNSVKLPSIHGLPSGRYSSKFGQCVAQKDQSAASPKSAAMWQRISKFARLPGLTSARLPMTLLV